MMLQRPVEPATDNGHGKQAILLADDQAPEREVKQRLMSITARPYWRVEKLVVLAIALAFAGQTWPRGDGQKPLTKSEIGRRGHALHGEIVAAYADLNARHAVKADNDVKVIVLKYIPIGITFDEAENILRAAGCEVGIRYAGMVNSVIPLEEQIGRRRVDARLGMDFAELFFVSLFPRGPNDYSGVGNLSASIIRQNL
jgi:hypothetical protein